MAMVADSVLDAALAVIATSTAVHICSAEPANHAGISAVTLGNYTVDGSDFTIANGDVSGRKTTLGAQSGNNATGSGNANFLAFTNGTTLLLTIPGDGDAVTNGSPFTIAATNVYEIRDPA